jgi:hypothetical protein
MSSWQFWVTWAALVVAVAVVAANLGRPGPARRQDTGAGVTAGVDEEPRLPGAAAWPPEWLAAEPDHPFDLAAFFAPVPAAENAAPLYLDALVPVQADSWVSGSRCSHP